MAVEIEGLEFKIQASAQNGAKSIDELANGLTKLRNAAKGGVGLTTTVNQLNKLNEALSKIKLDNVDDADSKLSKLADTLEKIKGIGNVTISSTLSKRLNDLTGSMQSLNDDDIDKLDRLANVLDKFRGIENIRIPKLNVPGTASTGSSATPTANVASMEPVDSEVEQVTSQVQVMNDSLAEGTAETNRLARGFREIISTNPVMVFKTIGNGLKSMTQTIAKLAYQGLFKVLNVNIKLLSGAVSVATKSFKGLASVATYLPRLLGSRLATKIKTTTSALGRFLSSLKRIAMYRMVRFVISSITQGFGEGIKNLYQYSLIMGTDFANSMDKLATSSQYLKNSLAAMVSPIINSLAPAVDLVVDKFVSLLNVVNQTISKLSGKDTYTAARKIPKSWEEAAADTKKAIDDIKRYTLGFDELNILGKQKSDKGSSDSSVVDYASMFEELPIENTIGNFADRLKELIKKGDWEGLGSTIGEKVNEGINKIPWAKTGELLGKGINGAVKTAYSLLDTINFKKIGGNIATFLNNALSEIDFEFVGRLMVKPFTSVADLIIGFVNTLDWGQVASSISKSIRGIFDESSEWLKSVDWNKFGTNLYKNLKAAIEGIDFPALAKSLFTFLASAISAAAKTIGSFVGSLADDFKKWWDKDIKGANWKETGANLLNAIGKAIVIGSDFVFDYFVKPLAENLFDADWSEIRAAGKEMFDEFVNGIKDKFNNIKNWIKTNIVNPFVNGIKNLFGIHSPSTVTKDIGDDVAAGFLNGLKAPFVTIKDWVWENIAKPLSDAVSHIDLEAMVKGDFSGNDYFTDGIAGMGSLPVNVALALKKAQESGDPSKTIEDLLKTGSLSVEEAIKVKHVLDTHKEIQLQINAKANIVDFINSLKTDPKVNSIANFNSANANAISGTSINTKANFTTMNGKGIEGSSINTKANFNTYNSKSVEGTSIKTKANFTSYLTSAIKNAQSNVKAMFNAYDRNGINSAWSYVKAIFNSYSTTDSRGNIKSAWNYMKAIFNDYSTIDSRGNIKGSWNYMKAVFNTYDANKISDATIYCKAVIDQVVGSFAGLVGSFMADGGVVTAHGKVNWDNIPKYAGGTVNAHGSMFIAGEAGSELVGHINGRTEVLNKSQLGQIMHSAIVDGMYQFTEYWRNLGSRMTICTNGIISAMLSIADVTNRSITNLSIPANDYISVMNELDTQTRYDLGETDTAEAIADGVRMGLYDSTSRQNDLLREQNELLRELLDKESTVEITANSLTKAMSRKNQRDGKTVIPISN